MALLKTSKLVAWLSGKPIGQVVGFIHMDFVSIPCPHQDIDSLTGLYLKYLPSFGIIEQEKENLAWRLDEFLQATTVCPMMWQIPLLLPRLLRHLLGMIIINL